MLTLGSWHIETIYSETRFLKTKDLVVQELTRHSQYVSPTYGPLNIVQDFHALSLFFPEVVHQTIDIILCPVIQAQPTNAIMSLLAYPTHPYRQSVLSAGPWPEPSHLSF